MNIYVNDKTETIKANTKLKEYFNANFKNDFGIAIAVNNQIIKKNNWENFELSENDRLTIIKISQGG